MANANQVSGFAPVRYLSGSPWNGAANLYCIKAADTAAYFVGDPVTTIGNAGSDGNGIPAVTLAAAGAAVRGVIVGIGKGPAGGPIVDFANLEAVQRSAGAKTVNYYCLVVDDPDVLFEIQEGVSTALTEASVNRNANFHLGARTAGLPLSTVYLDNSTVSTTSTLNCKLFGLAQRVDNAFGAYAKWLVKINNHEFSTGTTAP